MGPVPVAARSKAWVCCRLLAGIAGSNPAVGMMSVVSVVCCLCEGPIAHSEEPYRVLFVSVW